MELRSPPNPPVPLPTLNLRDLDRLALVQALGECGGNRLAACQALGISLSTLCRRLRRYGGTKREARGTRGDSLAPHNSRLAPAQLPTCHLEALRYLALCQCANDSVREAARKLGCSRPTVQHLRQRLHFDGEQPYSVRQALAATVRWEKQGASKTCG